MTRADLLGSDETVDVLGDLLRRVVIKVVLLQGESASTCRKATVEVGGGGDLQAEAVVPPVHFLVNDGGAEDSFLGNQLHHLQHLRLRRQRVGRGLKNAVSQWERKVQVAVERRNHLP